MLDGQATDILEGSSLSFQSDYIDIYSNCWGPKDDGKTFGKPGKLAQEALMQGALKVCFLFNQKILILYPRNNLGDCCKCFDSSSLVTRIYSRVR